MLHLLKTLKFPSQICNSLKRITSQWRTTLSYQADSNKTCNIAIQRGMLQGDTLSSMWFILSLLPVGKYLSSTAGYQIIQTSPEPATAKVTHLYFVDDLKIYAKNIKLLHEILDKIRELSLQFGLEFNASKTKLLTVKRGKIQNAAENPTAFALLDNDATYKYLGLEQRLVTDDENIKSRILAKYLERMQKVWSSPLTGKLKARAHNTFACSVFAYVFPIISYTKRELHDLDITTRKMLTEKGCHHSRSSVARLYIERSKGGRGLVNLEQMYHTANETLYHYLTNSNNEYLKTICANELAKGSTSKFQCVQSQYEQLQCNHTTYKDALQKVLVDDYDQKIIHGKYIKDVPSGFTINLPLTHSWLLSNHIFSDTEGFFVAIQDGFATTRHSRMHIYKENISDVCRKCGSLQETTDHILSACPVHARIAYVKRHNFVVKILWSWLLRHYNISDVNSYVAESADATIFWDQRIYTGAVDIRTEQRPDLTVFTPTEVILFEVSVPNSTNIQKKYFEKEAKYSELRSYLARTHKQNVRQVNIIISSTGVIPQIVVEKFLEIYPSEKLLITQLLKELVRSVIISSATIVKRHLSS